MTAANFRKTYLEIVHDILGITERSADRHFAWFIEYLAREGIWYQFSGVADADIQFSHGRQWDTSSTLETDVDSQSLSQALLQFSTNRAIAAYCGESSGCVEILRETTAFADDPEVLAVYLCEGAASDREPTAVTSTKFVFLGFETINDRLAGPRPGFRHILSAGAPNKGWHLGREFFEANPHF